MFNPVDLTNTSSKLASGHRSCAGCGFPPVVRTILRAINGPTVVCVATGCLEVTTTIYPQTSWEIPIIHSAFENAAATISGMEAAFEYLKKMGKWAARSQEPVFVVFAGDGGTYDIGLQSLSGAIERGHNFLYVCYNNEAYMNTGVQRSSASPFGAETTTSPAGSLSFGKKLFAKPLTEIIAAHGLPYVAQASVSHLSDLYAKVQKALSFKGPKFVNVLATCPLGWKLDSSLSIEAARLAVETRYWPLYEVENGAYRVTVDVQNPKPLEEFLKMQGRFGKLLEDEMAMDFVKKDVDRTWIELNLKTQSAKLKTTS